MKRNEDEESGRDSQESDLGYPEEDTYFPDMVLSAYMADDMAAIYYYCLEE